MSADVKSQLDELHRISEEQWAKYQKLLPKSDDVSLVVLKGHLIIEEMLYAIAERHCADPNALAEAKLSFAQLHHVVRSLVKLPVMESCSDAICLLNAVRNSLVHNLEPQKLDSRLSALQKMCEPSDGVWPENYVKPTDAARIAESCICFIIGQLNVIGVISAFLERNPQMFASKDAT